MLFEVEFVADDDDDVAAACCVCDSESAHSMAAFVDAPAPNQ